MNFMVCKVYLDAVKRKEGREKGRILKRVEPQVTFRNGEGTVSELGMP